jgi:putative acetyltransferase
MPSALLTRAALDTDRDGLIQLIGTTYAEYPGCVLAVEQEEQDLLGIASAYARYGGEFWVTIDPASGELVASIGWLPSSAAERKGWLELRKLYVARAQRRRGLASALVARVESAARERGAPGVELWSDTRFLDAHRLYARHGYRLGAQRELFDLSRSVEYHFEKRLQ